MSIKEIQEFSPSFSFYNLKDKAYNHVLLRIFKAYEETEAIRNNVKTPEEFNVWQQNIKSVFKESVGELLYNRFHPLNATITGRIEEEKLTIEKVIFESRARVYVTANVYLPRVREEKCPAVLLQCGHSLNGKASEAYQRAARIIAGVGIIVLVMDPAGQGERTFYKEPDRVEPYLKGATTEHQQFGNQCFLNGSVPVNYFISDAMRAIDYLCSREDVDPDRIGATGNSGGGTLTALLMLMDERIKAAAPSCWPSSGREYFVAGSAPDAEQIWPGVAKNHLDHYEIIASMCPKPLLLLAQESDFVPIEGTEKLFAECQKLWKLNGAEERVGIHVAEGSHGFSQSNARAAAEFFSEYLIGNDGEVIVNSPVTILPEEQLYCTRSGRVMEDFADSESVFHENLREYRKKMSNRESEEWRKNALRAHVYAERRPIEKPHLKKLHSICMEELQADMLLWFTQDMMPCYGVSFKPTEYTDSKLPVTICLWHRGTDRLIDHETVVREICESGRIALVVDLSAMGKCTPHRTLSAQEEFENLRSVTDKLCKALFMLGDSLCALQAFDLMQTVNMVRERLGTEDVEIYAEGKECVLARIAEMLDEKLKIRTADEVRVSKIITDKYYDSYDIAHVLMPGLANYLD